MYVPRSGRFKVGMCSGRFGSLQGRSIASRSGRSDRFKVGRSVRFGPRSGRSGPPTSPFFLFVPKPRTDVYAEGKPQRGAGEANVGYRIRNSSNNIIHVNNDSRDTYYLSGRSFPRVGKQLPQGTSPGWGSNYPRVLPQVGGVQSPG